MLAARLKVLIEGDNTSAISALREANAAAVAAAGGLTKTQRASKEAADALIAAGLAVRDMDGRLTKLDGRALSSTAALHWLETAAKGTEDELKDLLRASMGAAAAVGDVGDEAEQASVGLEVVDAAAAGAAEELNTVDRKSGQAARGLGSTDRAAGRSARSLGLVAIASRLSGGALKSLLPAAMAAAGGLAALAAQSAIASTLNLASALVPLAGVLGVLPAAGAGAALGLGVALLAARGLKDALSNMDDPAAFAAALEKLSPAGRELATTLRDLRAPFDALGQSVQGAALQGVGPMIRDLASTYLPVLTAGLTHIAVEMNAAIGVVKRFLTEGRTVADIGSIMDNVAVAMGRARGAIEPILGIFRDLTAVGATFLPSLASAFSNAAQGAGAFMANARETGKLGEWMKAGLDTAGQLGRILGDVGGILKGVLAQSNGAGLFAGVERLTSGLNGLANSAQGQKAIGLFFSSAQTAAEALMPLLPALAGVISGLLPVLVNLGTSFAPGLVSFISALGPALAALAPAGTALGSALGGALTALVPVLPVLAKAFGDIVVALSPLLVQLVTLLVPIINALLPVISSLVAGLAGGLGLILPPLAAALMQVVTAVAPLLPVLMDLLTNAIVPLLTPLLALVGPLAALAVTIVQAAMPALTILGEILGRVVAAVAPLIERLTVGLAPVFAALGPVLGSIAELVGVLVDALLPLLPGVVDLALSLANFLVPILEIFASILGMVIHAIEPLLTLLALLISTIASTAGHLLDGITWVLNKVKGTVIGFFTGAGDWLRDVGHMLMDGLTNGLKDFAENPIKAIGNLAGSMLDKFKGLFGIHSPSRVMAEMGVHLMSGLAGGITSGQPMVGATMADLQDLIALKSPDFSPASMGLGARIGAPAAGTGTVINVTVNIPAGTTAADSAAISSSADTAVRAAMDSVFRDGRVALKQSRGV